MICKKSEDCICLCYFCVYMIINLYQFTYGRKFTTKIWKQFHIFENGKGGKTHLLLRCQKDKTTDSLYITITESKKNTIDDEQKKQVAFTKQRLLLYKEDFGNFVEALNECFDFIDMSDNEQNEGAKQLSVKSDFDDIDFDIWKYLCAFDVSDSDVLLQKRVAPERTTLFTNFKNINFLWIWVSNGTRTHDQRNHNPLL